jgi:hypothetical protein
VMAALAPMCHLLDFDVPSADARRLRVKTA